MMESVHLGSKVFGCRSSNIDCASQEINVKDESNTSYIYNLKPKDRNVYLFSNELHSYLIGYYGDGDEEEFKIEYDFGLPIHNIEIYEIELSKHIDKLLKLRIFK